MYIISFVKIPNYYLILTSHNTETIYNGNQILHVNYLSINNYFSLICLRFKANFTELIRCGHHIRKTIAYTRRYILYVFTTSNACQALGANTHGIAYIIFFAVWQYKRSNFTLPSIYISFRLFSHNLISVYRSLFLYLNKNSSKHPLPRFTV